MTIASVMTKAPGSCIHILWEAVTESDGTGDASTFPALSDRCVQVVGTFNGNTLLLQGSNVINPTVASDWFTLHNHLGDLLSFTAVGGDVVAENPYHIRPKSTGGTGVDVDVHLFGRA
jgi:hypothetical protein